jgi:hypothetical protein
LLPVTFEMRARVAVAAAARRGFREGFLRAIADRLKNGTAAAARPRKLQVKLDQNVNQKGTACETCSD